MATNTTNTFTNHTGNGTEVNFSISFSYILTSDIDVTVAGVTKTLGTHYTISGSTVTFTSGNVPANGAAIKFQRDTSISTKAVDFQDGSVLTEQDLDNNTNQVLFAQQEITDKLNGIEDGATADQTAAEIRTLVESASDSNVFTDADHTKLNNIEANATQDQTVSEIKSLIAGSPLDASHLAANSVDSSELVDGSVDTSHLSADCVTNAKIADDSIDSEHYVDGSIDTQHIGNSQVTTDKIANSNVTTAKIADSSITSAKIVDGAISTADISDGNITTAKLAASGVTTDKIADTAVTNAKIASNAVGTNKLINSSVTTDKINTAAITRPKLADNAVTTEKIADAELRTLAGMQSGTASKLADSTALTSDIADLNQIDGLTKQTTISDSDASFPTSGAVVDYVAAQLAPIGGLEVIATDAAFPNTQPQSGVVISIADAGGLVVNSSGTSTTARTVGGSTVTINNFASNFNSSTVDAGVAIMVSSTGSGQIYNYHKATLKEADLLNLSNDINDFGNRYRVTNGEPSSNNDEGDLIYDTQADKMKVFDSTTNAFKEVTSVGDFKFLFLCPTGGSGSPTINGSIATYDLREGGTSGAAASVTNAAQLLVSINGVIQKPNTGTSAPSEGFAMVDSNTIVFGGNLPTGAEVFVIQIGSAISLQVPADNTVSTAKIQNQGVITSKIADNAVTGAKIADNLDIPDNNTIRLGSGNDLSLFHNGTNSHIHSATGELDIRSDDFHLRNAANNENMIVASANGSVELYYNNAKKIETSNVGANVSGNLNVNDGILAINHSTPIINFTDNSVSNGNDYSIQVNTNLFKIVDTTNNNRLGFQFGSDGNTTLGGNVTLSGDLRVSADSTHSIGTNTHRFANGYFDTLYGDGSNLTGVSSVGGATGVSFNDNIQAKFGNDDDLIIYADTNAKMQADNGDFIIQGNASNDILIDPKNNERGIVVKPDAEVELYYNNVMQFETRDGGATTPGWFASGINAQLNGAKGTFANDGTHLSCRSFATGGYDSIIFRSANTTVGRIHFNSGGTQYHTSSDYRRKENIVDLTGAIDRVKTLLPKRFNFITEPSVTRDGFLAHEVTAVPEAILGTKDQVATEKDVEEGKADAVGDPIYQTIDQSSLVPLLTAALKEAIAKIETLETKVAALEGK